MGDPLVEQYTTSKDPRADHHQKDADTRPSKDVKNDSPQFDAFSLLSSAAFIRPSHLSSPSTTKPKITALAISANVPQSVIQYSLLVCLI